MTAKEKEEIMTIVERDDVPEEVKSSIREYVDKAEPSVDVYEKLTEERDNAVSDYNAVVTKYEDLKEKYIKRIITPSGDKIEYEREEKDEAPKEIFIEKEIVK